MWCGKNSTQDETEESSNHVEHVHNSKPKLVWATSYEEYHVQEEAENFKHRHSDQDLFDFHDGLLESVGVIK